MEPHEAIDKLKDELRTKGFSQLTAKNYCFFVEKFLAFSGKKAEELVEDDAKSYLASLFDTKSKATISLAASSIRFFFSLFGKPLNKLSLPKKDKNIPVVLSRDEVRKILDSAETHKSRMMLSLLYSSGLRVSELVNLKKLNLNLDEKSGWVRKTKGSKDRMFSIPEVLCSNIKEHLEKNPDNIFVFSKEKPLTTRNIQKIIQLTAKKAGILKKVTPHTLRHSFAAHLLESGVDIRVVQELLGYAPLNASNLHTRVSQEQLKSIKNPLDMLNEKPN